MFAQTSKGVQNALCCNKYTETVKGVQGTSVDKPLLWPTDKTGEGHGNRIIFIVQHFFLRNGQ